MTSLLLCALAFVATFMASRRSVVAGLTALMVVGYLYGITRANVPQSFSHFTFDAAVLAFYMVHLPRLWRPGQPWEVARLRSWMLLLIGWPVMLMLVPAQDPLIQVVGLRGSTFLVPFVVVGASLEVAELRRLGHNFALLNIAVFGVALAEFFMGIEPFFPRNAVTELIYRSRDVAGYSAYRIPATFSSAHAYGGTLVTSMPFVVGIWSDPGRTRRSQLLATVAVALSAIGIFMTAARQPTLMLLVLGLVAALMGRMRMGTRFGLVFLGLVVAVAVSSSARLQRFRTLEDTEAVTERVQGSVNSTFLDLAVKYPLGNGLGGGGTSVPYFLQDRIRDPVTMENEYARIMLEQGLIGLVIWVSFIGWMAITALRRPAPELALGQRLALTVLVLFFGSGLIGTGTLTSIPGTVVLLLGCGWACGVTVVRRAAAPAGRPGPLPLDDALPPHRAEPWRA